MTNAWRTRRVLAVMAVTTALCAEHAGFAAPATRAQPPELAELASRLVVRLAANLRRTLPTAMAEPAGRDRLAQPAAPRWVSIARVLGAHLPLAAFEFRLPPPLA